MADVTITYVSVFTGIVAMDPAAPIFDTNSKGTLEISYTKYHLHIFLEVKLFDFWYIHLLLILTDYRLDRCDAAWVDAIHTHTMQHGFSVIFMF